MRSRLLTALVTAILIPSAAAPARAQTPEPPADAQEEAPTASEEDTEALPSEVLGVPLTFGLSGNATISAGVYRSHGVEGRRPGETWRFTLAPTLQLPLGMSAGMNVLFSSEGSDFRQNINQFGISPSWGWGTVHLGDFSRDLTPYTVQGLRIRGLGLDLEPERLRFSLQGGRVQRAAVGLDGEAAYTRYLVGGRIGYGDDGASYLELNVVKAKDDASSLEDVVVLPDTLLLDTIPEGLRPQRQTTATPQENLVTGLAGRLTLLDRTLELEGELSGALTTLDVTSPRASADAAGVPGVVDALHPLRLSTSGDYAYSLAARVNLSAVRIRGRYEYIGPGYNSAGLAYIINDRQAYQLTGMTRLWDSRVVVQGRYDHQNNNLLEQRRSTTTRDVANATVSIRATDRIMATLTGLTSLVSNDAPVDQGGLENRARSLNANVSVQRPLFGIPSTVSVMYGLHHMSGRAAAPIPTTMVHNFSGSVQVSVLEDVSIAPSVSGVVRDVEGGGGETNVLFGFRGRARFLDGKLRSSANVSHTFSGGREIFTSMARVSYPIFTGATLSFLARHNTYSAFAGRPAFGESFATLTLSTSF